jgi:AAA domain
MNPTEPTPLPPAMSFDDLKAAAARPSWLWQGYLAAGNVTLLTSQWKSGKTTLASLLLARLKGGGRLAGLKVKPGKAVVVSEEGPAHWVRRGEKLDLAGHVCWFCRPFRSKPRPEQWLALLDRILELRRRHGLGLALIDPLAAFLPGRDENSAGSMLEALLPLQRLTAEGMAVLVLHHPRKGEPAAGQAARGSGALSGYVDVLIEMNWYGRTADNDRRRKLRAWSRHEETPRELVIELAADGTDYRALGDFEAEAFSAGWPVALRLLEEARETLTRKELLERWPPDLAAPAETTLWQWLERDVAEGRLCRSGSGRRNSPFRYWPAGRQPRRNGLPELPPLPDLD